jgi:hypothetical protein
MSCSSCNYLGSSSNIYENTTYCDDCYTTQNTYQCSNISPITKYSCLDGSGNVIVDYRPPPVCGTCPLKINSIPRSPYRSLETPMSVYMSNLSSLYVYQRPTLLFHNVNWNQSSDRAIPHIQPTNVQRNTSSLRGTRTGSKPGSMVPGGVGVDIKHNSFNRYNLRLRGAVLKTKPIASTILKFPSYRFKSQSCYDC